MGGLVVPLPSKQHKLIFEKFKLKGFYFILILAKVIMYVAQTSFTFMF